MGITNTTEQLRRDPSRMLAESMLFGSSGAIERQEADGQRELVNAAVLPVNGIEKMRHMIEANGGSIGKPVSGDPIFVNVVLPTGWTKVATDHSMWSNLLDAKGRKRAGIFYKAAFYDRSAHISPDCRFSLDSYARSTDDRAVVFVFDACGEVEFELACDVPPESHRYNMIDGLRDKVSAHMDEAYPLWRDASAYWD